jgi:cytoskeletal protein CcmA (bactofilin family)
LFPRPSSLLLLLLLLPTLVHAQASESPQGRHEATIAGDYFGAGSNFSPGTAVEGDAFVAGGQVLLQTPVGGDAVVSGGSVSVSAPVGDDLYATGGRVTLESPVSGNARLAGNRVEIAKSGRVAGKATLAGRVVNLYGQVGRQLTVFGDEVLIDGDVAGNVTVAARHLVLGPNARISGKLTHRGPTPAEVDPAAVIGGGTKNIDYVANGGWQASTPMSWILGGAFTFGLFLLGLCAVLFAPLPTAKVGLLVRGRVLGSIGTGLAVIFGSPVLAFVLALTVVGLPLAFVMLLSWPLVLVFGYLMGVLALTDALAGSSRKKLPGSGLRIFSLALGLAAMLLLCWVPLAAWIVGSLLTVVGVGAMTLNAFGVVTVPRQRRSAEPVVAEDPVMFRREPTFRM